VGNIASLALDSSIAMRIKFEGRPPPQSVLYFRGPVLSRFDGREWLPPTPRPGGREMPANLNVLGPPLNYEVTLEPSNRPWLFVVDATAQAPRLPGFELRQTPQLQWLTSRPLTDIVRYSASSHPDFRYGPTRASGAALIALRDDVALPAGFNPRTIALAAELRRDPALATAPAPVLVQAVLQRLRSGGYRYTLDPGVSGPHSADEFWFDRREGFCEHIASAFVILMRALDVPARVVTGYQGGEVNSVDGFWTVRQSDAHAWAEVWEDRAGWVRVDPTGAVSPGRIGTFQRLQAPQGVIATALVTLSPDLLARLRESWEAVNNSWNQWVLNYTQSKQLNLLKNLGFESPSWEDLARLLMGILVLASLVGAAWTLWEQSQHDPWLRLLSRARRKLAAAGVAVPAQAPPRELARLAGQHFGSGPRALALQQWLLQMEQLRYAPVASKAASRQRLATLRREFNHLAWLDR
jgi:transglutaminase-like putative cysteine protease